MSKVYLFLLFVAGAGSVIWFVVMWITLEAPPFITAYGRLCHRHWRMRRRYRRLVKARPMLNEISQWRKELAAQAMEDPEGFLKSK